MSKKSSKLSPQLKPAAVPLKAYLPEEISDYIRARADANFRTINGQVEAMLRYAKAAGI